MHGNVWEYCNTTSDYLVLKGASYVDLEPDDKLLWRGEEYEIHKRRIGSGANIGFRCVYAEVESGDATAHAPSAPPLESEATSLPRLAAEIAALCEQATNGTPTTFICYGPDEGLFMARLKPFSAYAATTDGRFTVVGVRDNASNDFMVVCTGSKAEHAAFSAEGSGGGAVDRLDHELLTEEELRMRRPVSAYSNFAKAGCDLMSLDGFNRCVSDLRSGRYAVVTVPVRQVPPKPNVIATSTRCEAELGETQPNSGDISSLVPDLTSFVQDQRASVHNDPDLTLQRNEYENIFGAMARLSIVATASLPAKATRKGAASAAVVVGNMGFYLAQSIAQGAHLKIESVSNGVLRVQAGCWDSFVGRTGTNEFRAWFES
jgi:hypothetical protein